MGFSHKNTGGGSHSLLQGIFLTQGSNLPPCIAGGFLTAEPLGKPNHCSVWHLHQGGSRTPNDQPASHFFQKKNAYMTSQSISAETA